MPTARRSIDVDVPPAALMRVITDFASYPRFLTDMEEATVLRSEPGDWTVKFAVRIIRRIEYTLRLRQLSETRLRWSLVEGAFKSNDGGWELDALDGGTRTRATYELSIDLGMFVPGSVLKTLLEHNLPATLEAFKRRAEKR
ncbi:MAG: type II toxin-antitoxin system RatA family toxin [Myxococcota bacterium]